MSLMNRVSTKAVEGRTPYEAVFRRKPDLQRVYKWGEKVYVCVKDRNKLGGCVKER